MATAPKVIARLAFSNVLCLYRSFNAVVRCTPRSAPRIGQYSSMQVTHAHLEKRVERLVRRCHTVSSSLSLGADSSVQLHSVMKYKMVPDKLPDWWDDEDDDDEDNADIKMGKGGGGFEGGGGRGGGGGSGGGGSSEEEGNGGDGGNHGDGNGFFAALLAMYIRSIKTNPIRTKAASTCLLALLGDYFAQRIAQQGSSEFTIDARRSASIALWGFCFMGPVLHYWYGLLDRMIVGRYAVLGKVFSDQLFFAPFFNGAFIAGVGSLEGHPSKEVLETVRTKLWPSMKANWTLWPAAQFINFAIIPRTFQIVYVNCVALVWNVILTYISHDLDDK